jgi:putative membrane protein
MDDAPVAGATAPSVPLPGLEGSWQRLHPLSPLVRAGRGLVPIVLILLIPSYGARGGSSNEVEHVGLIVAVIVFAVISWLVTRWRVEGEVLRVDSGLIRRTSERFPLSQIQAIDIVRPGLARLFGLSELRIRLAAGGQRAGRLAYLSSSHAEALRARLLAMSHRVSEEKLAAQPERALLTVSPALLLVSLAFTSTGFVLEVVLGALVALAIVAPAAATASVSASAVWLFGLVVGVYRRFNAGYRLTVAKAPDGLRLRSGLVETTAETIPRGRIQALRMTEPIAWRIFGWCRLDVDIASQRSRGRQDRNAARAVRALLPVGSRAEAMMLVGTVIPDPPRELSRPPARARVKSPLRFRFLSWGAGEACAVTTSGRLTRVTDWVLWSKVQSVRRVEGPVQRALGLSSIHLDTAGRRVHAVLRDRDQAEASGLLRELPDRCRRARRQEDDTSAQAAAASVRGERASDPANDGGAIAR